jgi:TetR/AcrR family transcriptional repressor of nem operon
MNRVKPEPEPKRRGRGTRVQVAENRERIVAAAARAFRARGFSGIGVAELMREVGLTHGGFYGHFASKDELIQLACRRAVDEMLAEWRTRAAAAPGDPARAVVAPYLSPEHRDAPESGCLMAAVGPEARRAAPSVRRVVTECLGDVLDTIAGEMPAADPAGRRAQAIETFTALVGAMVVARAVDDPALSTEILEGARAGLDRALTRR